MILLLRLPLCKVDSIRNIKMLSQWTELCHRATVSVMWIPTNCPVFSLNAVYDSYNG